MSFCADDAANQAAREVMVQMADDTDMRETFGRPLERRFEEGGERGDGGVVRKLAREVVEFGIENVESVGDVRTEVGHNCAARAGVSRGYCFLG